jgi:hypothetical protein
VNGDNFALFTGSIREEFNGDRRSDANAQVIANNGDKICEPRLRQ